MKEKVYLKWEEVDKTWENSDWLWEDVSIYLEIGRLVGNSGGYSEYTKNNPWEKLRKDVGEEKTKKIIKLYCKFKDIEYEKVVENGNDIKVTANEFENFIRDGISIKVNI